MLTAYHGKAEIKTAILSQLQAHYDADQLVKGQYWEDGKGCAVGCTIYSGEHAEYETSFGIPQMLAHLEDRIFEGLPNDKAKEWPLRFMRAILPGSDLSLVGWRFQHWLLTDEAVNPGIKHPLVADAVAQCVGIVSKLAKGEVVPESAALDAVSSAESAARSATWGSAEWSAWSAWNAAKSAAKSAADAARNAAKSAESATGAWSAAGAAYILMSDKLIALIEAA